MSASPHSLGSLAAPSNSLAPHYARFRVAERLLLTGHSHQAWPDVAFEGQQRAWLDAAAHVDEKWDHARAQAAHVQQGFARLLGDESGLIVLGASTHELVVRWLSALPLAKRPRIVTTDGEFHTLRRQLDRLAEARLIEVVKVAASPASSIAERAAAAVDDRTAAACVSSVLFANAHLVEGLAGLADACARRGCELLVDSYHHLGVVPWSLGGGGLERAFVVGGGYKYCQLGEGNCFLRVPAGRDDLSPVVTGWYSEFALLADAPSQRVRYDEGAERWAGATYDPASHYRAARVFAFFEEQGLTPALLREVSQHQVGRLAEGFDALGLDPGVIARDRSVPLERLGGFLALECSRAGELSDRLRVLGVHTDSRAHSLRLGPAPYLSDAQLDRAIGILAEAASQVR